MEYYDEPFANSSAIGAYHCARMARETGVTTLRAGDGGDELFAGNERYATDKRFSLYRHVPAFLRKGLIEPVSSLLPQNESRFSLPGATSSALTFLFAPHYSYHLLLRHPAGRNVRACFTGKRSTANLAEHSRRNTFILP